ncbi:tape measure protein [Pseudoduganella sp. FT26W]|uniref:Tape measure protein n=1 Tax=Duganella aquatilis TaxID=2666082 RepID=A0A844CVT0_9BURK|nr:tape measure protein [Duganella aquatilis]MRW82881.1 tape measure protein [Duganella aquatilis]
MTVDIATLGIRIDSSEARTAARDMENFRGAGARAEQQVTAIDVAARKAAQALQFLGIGVGVGAIIKMADEYTKFTAQLQLATQSQREYAAAVEDVRRIAATAQQDLAATGTLYARIANGTRELGISQKNVADITETVNLALKVSGATSAEAASAMLQLSQSFASGTLRGEEFNAVNEAAPRLMKALADGIGVPVGALKDMASNGEITSKVMAQVLPQALQQLQEEAKHVQTISGAFTVLKNNVLEFTGTQAQANGTVAALTSGIMLLANNLSILMGVIGTITAVNVANWLTAWTTKTYERITAVYAQVAAENAARAAIIASAEAQVSNTAATTAGLQATQAAIVVAREEMVARLGVANANIQTAQASIASTDALAAQARAAIAASSAAGALSTALRVLRDSNRELAVQEAIRVGLQADLAVAEQARAAATAELAILGQQQARVSAQVTAATAAQTAAQTALTAATGTAAASAGLLSRAMGLLGGPVGAVVTVLGLAATAWSWYSSRSTEANTKTAEETKASTAEVVVQMTKQIEVMERRNKLALAGMPSTGKQNPLDDKLAEIIAESEKVAKSQGDYANLSYEARGEILKVLGGQYGEVTALIERFNKASADGAGNTAAAKALVEIRERVTGVSGQYQKDLKTYQTALAEGVIGMAEYTAGVTTLAQETWKGSEAGKAAVASANKSAEAYKTLISSIREATATNKLELAAGIDASDAQKARIKLDQELASGKVKLTAGQLASVRAALAEEDASEKALKSQRSVAAAIAELNEQRRQDFATAAAEAAANEQAAATFGLTKAQIEALTVARLQDRLVHAADLELTANDIAQTERLIAVKQKSADALTKTDALGYIKQLTEENRKFAADSIIDERARAAALTEIDADVWRKRIVLAGDGTEQQKQLQQQFDVWYRDQSIKLMLDEQREAIKKYDDVFRDGFADMLNHGKSGWKSFTTSLVTTFKTTVADQIYKMFAQPFVVRVVASLLGVTGAGAATAAQAAGGATGVAGSALSVASLYNAAKSAYAAVTGGFTSLASGVTETVQSGLNMLGTNTGFYSSAGSGLPASALAQGAGVVASYLAGAGVGKLIGSAISGEYQIGNHGSAITNISTIAGLFLGGPIGGAIGGAVSGLLNRAFGMGSKNVTSTSLQGSLTPTSSNIETVEAWTQKGGWFRSDKSGTDSTPLDATQSEAFSVTYKAILDVSKTLGDTIGADTAALSTRVQQLNIDLTGMKDATAQQEAITKFFAGVADTIGTELVPNLAQFQNEGEALSATLQRVATDYASVDVILGSIGKTFGAVGVSSIAARENLIKAAGGLDALSSSVSYFQQNVLSDSERLAQTQKDLAEQLQKLGLANFDSLDQYKQIVLGVDTTTQAGADLFAALLKLAPEVKAVAEAADAAVKAAKDLAEAKASEELERIAKAAEALTSAVDAALGQLESAISRQKDVLNAAYQAATDKLQASIDNVTSSVSKLQSLSQSLRSTLDALSGTDGSLSDRQAAQAQIEAALAIAKAGGPLPDADSLKNALSTVSKDASDQFSTYLDYQRDLYRTQSSVSQLADLTDNQLSTAEQTLATLQDQKDQLQKDHEAELAKLDEMLDQAKAQVDVLNGVSTALVSIPQALAALAQSISAAMNNSVAAAASQAQAAYQQYLGRDASSSEVDFWKDQAAGGVNVVGAIAGSDEAKIQDIYKTLLGRTGDAAGVDAWEAAIKAGMSWDQIKQGFLGSDEYQKLHSFDVGTNSVPYDMTANIHEGERIIPAADNRELMARLRAPIGDNSDLVSELQAQRAENAEMRQMLEAHLYAIAKNTLETADFLDGAVNGGVPLATKEVEETA